MKSPYLEWVYCITHFMVLQFVLSSTFASRGKTLNLQYINPEFSKQYLNRPTLPNGAGAVKWVQHPLHESSFFLQPPKFLSTKSVEQKQYGLHRIQNTVMRLNFLNSNFNKRLHLRLTGHKYALLPNSYGDEVAIINAVANTAAWYPGLLGRYFPMATTTVNNNLAGSSYLTVVERQRFLHQAQLGTNSLSSVSKLVASLRNNKVIYNGVYGSFVPTLYDLSLMQLDWAKMTTSGQSDNVPLNPNNVTKHTTKTSFITSYAAANKTFSPEKSRFVGRRASLIGGTPDGVASSDAKDHGGLMSPIKHHTHHSVAGAYKPPFDSVVNTPSLFSGENIGGSTEFTNPSSDPHLFGIPFTPNGDHNTWPSPVAGFEPRLPSIVHVDPMRTADFGTSSNPPDELGGMRPMTSTSIPRINTGFDTFRTSIFKSKGAMFPRFKSQNVEFVPRLKQNLFFRLHSQPYNLSSLPNVKSFVKSQKNSEGKSVEGVMDMPVLYRFSERLRRNNQAMLATARAEAFQLAEVKSGLYMGNGVRAPPGAFQMIETPYGRRLGFSPGHTSLRFAKLRKGHSARSQGQGLMAMDPVYPPTSPPPPAMIDSPPLPSIPDSFRL